MKYKLVKALVSIFLLFGALSANGELTGYISEDPSKKNIILTMSFVNKASHSLCIYHCPIYRDKVIDNLLADEFVLESESGKRVPYASFKASSGEELYNKNFRRRTGHPLIKQSRTGHPLIERCPLIER